MMRPVFTMNMKIPLQVYASQSFSQATSVRGFSLKMRKVREKQEKKGKLKLKTKKAFAKRFRVVS